MKVPDLSVGGMTVQVMRSPLPEGVHYRSAHLPQPSLLVPDGSDEVVARSILMYLHAEAARVAQPELVGLVLFGLMRDNPSAFRYLLHAEANGCGRGGVN